MSRSKVKVTRHKNALCTPITARSNGMERAGCKERHAAADATIPSGDFGGLRSVYVC